MDAFDAQQNLDAPELAGKCVSLWRRDLQELSLQLNLERVSAASSLVRCLRSVWFAARFRGTVSQAKSGRF